MPNGDKFYLFLLSYYPKQKALPQQNPLVRQRSFLCSFQMLKGKSAHYHFNGMYAAVEYRQYIAFNCLTIYCYRCNPLANMVRILDGNFVSTATELSGNREAIPFVRDRRIHLQTVPIRNNPQNVLGNSYKVPCCRTGQPAVLASPCRFASLPAII